MPSTRDWFMQHMRQIHLDFHMPEISPRSIRNFQAKPFVEHLRRGRINMIALFAKDHFGNAFYNTRVGHKHAGLSQDFLMEAATECRRHGIAVWAYYSLLTDVWAYTQRPHWRILDAQGNCHPQKGPWAFVCVNSSYKEELALPQCEEIARDYPVDGLWIDIPFCFRSQPPACYCPACQAKFQALFGRPLGAQTPADEAEAHHVRATTNFLRELREVCRRHNPELRIVTNEAWQLKAPRRFSEANDVGVWESQPRQNYLSHSFAARHVRTLAAPVQVMSVRFYQGWGDLSLKPAAQMTTEFAAMIGNGAAATSGDQVQVDGTLQPPVYEMFDRAFGLVEAREALLREARTVPDIAVLAPVKSADIHCPEAVGEAVQGAHKALLESHRQFDILSSLDLGKLADYRCVVLPEPCAYRDEVFPALRAWVQGGGSLVVAGGATLHHGRFELDDVLGVEFLEPSAFGVSHFKPRPIVRGETDDLPLQCRDRALKVIPRGAEVLADMIYPEVEPSPTFGFRHERCAPPSAGTAPHPFATLNRFGKGRAVYIAGPIFRLYWTTNHHWLRQFADAILGHLDPAPLYRVHFSGLLEANLMRHASGDLLLNLIHYAVGHQGSASAIPSIERVHPVRDVRCEVRATDVEAVTLEPAATPLCFETGNGYAVFTVPEIEYLATVRIRTRAAGAAHGRPPSGRRSARRPR